MLLVLFLVTALFLGKNGGQPELGDLGCYTHDETEHTGRQHILSTA